MLMVMLARTQLARAWRRAPLQHHPPRRFMGGRAVGEDFDLGVLDAKWQARWKTLESGWKTMNKPTKGKAYVLPMFPYPSGTLHLGHLRVYTISDVLARFKYMQGHEVLHPIGWDAFGLPAENAAIERGQHPETWTLQNIEAMKEQMKTMGGRFSWQCEFRTCDPKFYKHTQRLFLMLHEKGLAYQAEAMVNYDPVDKTVLANEQVDANGCSWRSGAKVEKVMLKQWFLRIKAFQDALLNDLDVLAENGTWPERVLAMQKNWLGKSEGTTLQFDVHRTSGGHRLGTIDVYTTRLDTLFGVQYVALSLKHPIVQDLAKKDDLLRAFLDRAHDLPPDSKEGYLLSGVVSKNPAATMAADVALDIPVYVAPYVLDDYGSGAVMGVPGNDTRDHAFWRANNGNSGIRQFVVEEDKVATKTLFSNTAEDRPHTAKGFVGSDIPEIGGLSSDKAIEVIRQRLQASGVSVEKKTNWRLKDWLISRQRYWGTPIPIIHCKECGAVPVPPQELPVVLPDLPDSFFKDRTGNPLAKDPHWKKCNCPKCGKAAERETDTMDTFMDSSWYFFRFLDANNRFGPVNGGRAAAGMPVDIYVGGVEHAILHLLYARFISKFLATTSFWPNGQEHHGEPFKQLITQGMVHGKTYSDPETGRFLRPDELEQTSNNSIPIIKASGLAANVSYEKMSKSKYNGVDPGKTISTYGADATRAHMLFQAPVSDVLEWDESKITGVQRWLQRVIRLSKVNFIPPHTLKSFRPPQSVDYNTIDLLAALRQMRVLKPIPLAHQGQQTLDPVEELLAALKPNEQKFWARLQELTASITKSYAETYSLNTIVSDLMTLTNLIWDQEHTSDTMSYLRFQATLNLLRMMAPITPAVAEEGCELLLSVVGTKIANQRDHPLNPTRYKSIFTLGFPVADIAVLPLLNAKNVCVFQVNGKKKFECMIRKPPIAIATGAKDGRNWFLEQLVETEKGREWLEKGEGKLWKISEGEKGDGEGEVEAHERFSVLPEGWFPIVVRNGRVVNVVGPGKGGMVRVEAEGSDPETAEVVGGLGERVEEAKSRSERRQGDQQGNPEI